MIRPRPLESSNKVQDLLDFQNTFQRGDTLEAMQMQQAPVQPMAMQPPPETMYMNQGGLVSLPIYNRSWGGIASALGSVIPGFATNVAIGAGAGTGIGAGVGILSGFLMDKLMGKKPNIPKNFAQGVIPAGMRYLRGGPRNFFPEGPSQGLGYSSDMQPESFGSRLIASAEDQFTLDELKKRAADAVIVEGLVPEKIDKPETKKDIDPYSGFGTQKFASVARDPNDPLEYDPRNPQLTQEEIFDISRGRRPRRFRKRKMERKTYTNTAREGGLAGIDFEGRVPGRSDGMEDDQYYAIRERGGPVEGLLAVSPKEYVIPADVMSILGNGNPDAGANDMDRFSKQVRMEAYGTPNQQKELDGFQTINSNLRG